MSEQTRDQIEAHAQEAVSGATQFILNAAIVVALLVLVIDQSLISGGAAFILVLAFGRVVIMDKIYEFYREKYGMGV